MGGQTLESDQHREARTDREVRAVREDELVWTRFRKRYRVHLIVGTVLFLGFCLYGLVAFIGRLKWGWTADQVSRWSWIAYVSMIASTLFSASAIGAGWRQATPHAQSW